MYSTNGSNQPTTKTDPPEGAHLMVFAAGLPSLLAILPYRLGYLPADSLCIVGVESTTRMVVWVLRLDLTDGAGLPSHLPIVVTMLAETPADAVVLVVYGSRHIVAPAVAAARAMLAGSGLRILHAVRADESHYWSYPENTSSRATPPDGVPYDTGTLATVMRSTEPTPPRQEQLTAAIAPEQGQARIAIQKATAHELNLSYGSGSDSPKPKELITETRDLIHTALRGYRAGQHLNDSEAAHLSFLLTMPRLRDEAAASITTEDLDAHRALWTDLTRRAVTGVPASAILLAHTCWLDNDPGRADIAITRALQADPFDHLAHAVAAIIALQIPLGDHPLITPEDLAAHDQDTADPPRHPE